MSIVTERSQRRLLDPKVRKFTPRKFKEIERTIDVMLACCDLLDSHGEGRAAHRLSEQASKIMACQSRILDKWQEARR